MPDEPVQNQPPTPAVPDQTGAPGRSQPSQPATTPTTDNTQQPNALTSPTDGPATQQPISIPSSEETPPPFPSNLPDQPSTNLGQDAVATPAPPAPDTGAGNIGSIPPVIVTPPAPTRSRAKIVGSILALLILIVGIPAGIFLVGQQQEIREKAALLPGQPPTSESPNCEGNLSFNPVGTAGVGTPIGSKIDVITAAFAGEGRGIASVETFIREPSNPNYNQQGMVGWTSVGKQNLSGETPSVRKAVTIPWNTGSLNNGPGIYEVMSIVANRDGDSTNLENNFYWANCRTTYQLSSEGAPQQPAQPVQPPPPADQPAPPAESAPATGVDGSICNRVKFYTTTTPRTQVSSIEAGKTYDIEVLMTNSSNITWTTDVYKLGFPTSGDKGSVPAGTALLAETKANDDRSANAWKFSWPGTPNRISLQTPQAPQSQASLGGVSVTASDSPGTYNFYWRMIKEGSYWFGAGCESDVTVYAAGAGGPTTPTNCPTSTSGYYCATSVFALPNQGSGCTNVEKTGGPSCAGADYCWQCVPGNPPTSDGGGGDGGGGDGGDSAPPPSITAQCLNVKAYNTTTGALLSATQLSQLKAGDTVRLAIGGSTSQPAIDRARFKINGQFAPDANGVTTKNSAGEFYYDYQIPVGTTSFSMGAELHHTDTSIGWF